MYVAPFSLLNDDNHAPVLPNLPHQQWENYGIYSIACISSNKFEVSVTYNYKKDGVKYIVKNGDLIPLNPLVTTENSQPEDYKLDKFLAYQTYSIRPIPVNFRQYVETYSNLGNAVLKNQQYCEITKIE